MKLNPQRDENISLSSQEHDDLDRSPEAPKDSPEFAFITSTGAHQQSQETQRFIRKHVMQKIGKSRRGLVPSRYRVLSVPLGVAGLRTGNFDESSSNSSNNHSDAGNDFTTRGARSSKKLASVSTETELSFMPSIGHPERFTNGEHSLAIERFGGGRSNPFANYPVEMNLQRLEVVDLIFNNQDLDLRQFREWWVPMGMMDPAGFYQVLANFLVHMSSSRIEFTKESEKARHFHTMALRSVNSRILDPNFVQSIGFLGTVLAFSCYYNMKAQDSKTDIHLAGLKEIVLRNGIDSLDSEPLIRDVLLWVDLGISSARDISPSYPLPYHISRRLDFSTQVLIPPSCAKIIELCRKAFTEHVELFDMIEDIARFTSWLELELTKTKGRIYEETQLCAGFFNPLIHRLLRFDPYSSTNARIEAKDCLEAYRLASILYLAEIRRKFGVTFVRSQVQLEKLWLLFQNSRLVWHQNGVLELWVATIGFIEEQKWERRKQYRARIRDATIKGGLVLNNNRWGRLKEFLWTELHEEKLFNLLLEEDSAENSKI